MKFVDLSLEIAPNVSEPVAVEIDYISHQDGADILGKSINIDHKKFPDEMGLTIEHVKLSTHTGTHLDAPVHYGPLCEGKPAKKIGELPLDWFYNDGVLLDCSSDLLTPITKSEIIQALVKIEYKIKRFDIVLLQTNADRLWGKPEYFTNYRGVTRQATEWLVNQGVKIIGIDSFGFDAPFHIMLQKYQQNNDSKELWPAHIFGREKEYCQIERLTNLSKIGKSTGFKVMCFPIKIQDCGAGWSRVVAMMEN